MDSDRSSPALVTNHNSGGKPVVDFPTLNPTTSQDGVLKPEMSLIECFYLGSSEMTGMEIRGRGCIDGPAGFIWEHSQQDRKPKRKNSWPMKHHDSAACTVSVSSFKPRYVRLVTGPDALQVYDDASNQVIAQFNYRKIAFVGTHPKYTRLFAFIAESTTAAAAPFCHAFKCEDVACAKQTACALSDLFNKKIQELLRSKKIAADAEATIIPQQE